MGIRNIVLRKGQPLNLDPQVVRWKSKMFKFRRLQKQMLELLVQHLKTEEKIMTWLKTPHPDLANATPRQFINPRQMKKLLAFVKKTFKEDASDQPK